MGSCWRREQTLDTILQNTKGVLSYQVDHHTSEIYLTYDKKITNPKLLLPRVSRFMESYKLKMSAATNYAA